MPLLPPLPRRFPWIARLRGLPRWGLAASLALHALLAAAVASYQPVGVPAAAEDVIYANIVGVTPPPPSPPPPTPVPTVRPLPAPQERVAAGGGVSARRPLPAAHAKPLKLNVYRSTSRTTGQAVEQGYTSPRGGSANGVPGGTGTAPAQGAAPAGVPGNGGTAAAIEAGTASPAPTATPRPPAPSPTATCAVPHADARAVHVVEAEYPAQAVTLRASGTVLVRITLTAAGAVADASVYRSAHNRFLDQAAVEAARASTYAPEEVQCVPVGGVDLFRADFNFEEQ